MLAIYFNQNCEINTEQYQEISTIKQQYPELVPMINHAIEKGKITYKDREGILWSRREEDRKRAFKILQKND